MVPQNSTNEVFLQNTVKMYMETSLDAPHISDVSYNSVSILCLFSFTQTSKQTKGNKVTSGKSHIPLGNIPFVCTVSHKSYSIAVEQGYYNYTVKRVIYTFICKDSLSNFIVTIENCQFNLFCFFF